MKTVSFFCFEIILNPSPFPKLPPAVACVAQATYKSSVGTQTTARKDTDNGEGHKKN
ncbi:hypothetical protein [Hugenholtzia roseola]|uniref:hypothetical protein n=1 Tax=Hugenholtzia roseola TaxID=1002 RepID=UPI0004185DB2|nr:hypothetical protein [Hugenholtzia roseola]